MHSKLAKAIEVITSCVGSNGVWASNDRYKNQCWTRDFCLATHKAMMTQTFCEVQPRPEAGGSNNNPPQKFEKAVAKKIITEQLMEIARRQRSNGQLPILYLDDEIQFVKDKINRLGEDKPVSFMLRRYAQNEIENLTPHTRDAELLFIVTVYNLLANDFGLDECRKQILMYACKKALEYIESNTTDGLMVGGDWRDTRYDLDDKTVLSNACLLYQVYKLMNNTKKMNKVYQTIQTKFFNGEYFVDYPGSNHFDIMGNSFAVIYGIADSTQSNSIFEHVQKNLATPFGFKMSETFLPALSATEESVMKNDKAVIWPFINGYLLLAMAKSGSAKWKNIAHVEFEKWLNVDGFYEWYDITNGNGYGSKDQVWSAALLLMVHDSLIDG